MIYVTATQTHADGYTATSTLPSGYATLADVRPRLRFRITCGWQKHGTHGLIRTVIFDGQTVTETVTYHEEE